MNAKAWTARYAQELGVDPPTGDEFRVLLDLAAVAAHSSERVAAPVACWLTARAGVSPQEGLEASRRIETTGDPDTGLDREPPRP